MRDDIESSRRGVGGYTIIEVLVALTLLLTAMVPLAIVLSTGLRATVTTNTRMQARELTATEIDRTRSLKFEAIGIGSATSKFATATNDAQLAPETGYAGLVAGPETVVTSSGDTFTVTRDVRLLVNSSKSVATKTKKIIVTVSWTDPAPASFIELSTVIGPTDMAK
ncbi:MAG: hypothetical protein WC828_06370 [Thermoleophilia bacterium]|jgi:hypothetical protein